ncbi:MAG: hypothetical protein WCD89_05980 [Anaerocolumna sp.]
MGLFDTWLQILEEISIVPAKASANFWLRIPPILKPMIIGGLSM